MKYPLQVNKVLIPVDFSDCSRKAFYIGLQYAKALDAEAIVLHVLEPLQPTDMAREKYVATTEEIARFEEGVKRRLNELFEEGGVDMIDRRRISSVLATGKPFDVIVKKAEELDVELIVMGTHGRTGLKHILIGSQAERVVRHAPCQVLCIKPDSAEDQD